MAGEAYHTRQVIVGHGGKDGVGVRSRSAESEYGVNLKTILLLDYVFSTLWRQSF